MPVKVHAVLVAATLAIAAAAPRAAAELADDIELKVTGAVTLGTGIRTEDPSTANFGRLAGNRTGHPGGLTSANSGGPDLNFDKNKPYSTVLKGFADLDLQGGRFGAFARVQAWYDYELEHGNRSYGNYPNRF